MQKGDVNKVYSGIIDCKTDHARVTWLFKYSGIMFLLTFKFYAQDFEWKLEQFSETSGWLHVYEREYKTGAKVFDGREKNSDLLLLARAKCQECFPVIEAFLDL